MTRVLAVIAIGLATLFAVVGIVQAATHELWFFSPSVEVGERVHLVFPRHVALPRSEPLRPPRRARDRRRRSSPSWLRRLRPFVACRSSRSCSRALYFSYSQSSLAALFVVTSRSRSSPATGARGSSPR